MPESNCNTFFKKDLTLVVLYRQLIMLPECCSIQCWDSKYTAAGTSLKISITLSREVQLN